MDNIKNEYKATLITQGGLEQIVSYGLPKLREFEKYVKLMDNEPELVEWLCGKDAGFADGFTDASIFDLAEKVAVQMDPRLAAWSERQAAKIKRLMPLVGKLKGTLPGST